MMSADPCTNAGYVFLSDAVGHYAALNLNTDADGNSCTSVFGSTVGTMTSGNVTFTAELQDSEVAVLAPSDVTNGSYAYTMLTLLVSESCSAQFILYRYLPPALPAPAAAAAPTAVALSLTYVNATAHCRNVTAAPCFAAGLNGIYDGFGDLALASKSTNASANCSAFIGSATPGAMPGATPNGSTFVFRFDNYAAYTGMLTPSSLVLTPFAVPQCSITFAVAPPTPTPYIGTLAYQSFART